jgi:hypothetical protein
MEIKVPFLKEPVGAGDLVKAATAAVGVKPCTPCQKRAETMNRMLTLKPRTDLWTAPPHMPPGWRLHKEYSSPNKIIRLFVNDQTGGSVILDIVGDQYLNYRGFCCGTLRERAEQKWEEACRSL